MWIRIVSQLETLKAPFRSSLRLHRATFAPFSRHSFPKHKIGPCIVANSEPMSIVGDAAMFLAQVEILRFHTPHIPDILDKIVPDTENGSDSRIAGRGPKKLATKGQAGQGPTERVAGSERGPYTGF
jgi:hypothetical protein